MLKTYLILIAATFFEVAGTMLLPVTRGFSKPLPTGLLIVFYIDLIKLLIVINSFFFAYNNNINTLNIFN